MKFLLKCFLVLISFSCSISIISVTSVQAESETTIDLDFIPSDTALDPVKPVIYMTKLGSKTLYAVNYKTREIYTLTLPYPAERLDLKNNKIYITQLKMSHSNSATRPNFGAITEVDTDTFTVTNTMDINTDPYDIAVDNNGYIYISPGSGQRGNLRVYSIKENKEIIQSSSSLSVSQLSNIFFNSDNGKLYADESSFKAYEIEDGVIKSYYYPNHGNNSVGISGMFSTDGKNYYSVNGNVFNTAPAKSGDMAFNFSFGRYYNDFAFSQEDQLTFAANETTGIDVYQYGTKKYLYPLRKDLIVKKLLYQNGVLITINKGSDDRIFIETIDSDTQPSNSLPSTSGKPDPIGTIDNLGFNPTDTVMDMSNPVVYMTKPGSKTIFAVNVSTGKIRALALPYPAERLALYNNKLYVTQQMMEHHANTTTPFGAIAEVDTNTFTATKIIYVDTDPFDITTDEKGYIYISPGTVSSPMKIYSLATGGEISNYRQAHMQYDSYLYYHSEFSKVYELSLGLSPSTVRAYEIDNGTLKTQYNTPHHGEYPIESSAQITPDGSHMFNNSGVVFELAMYKSGDMKYAYRLGREYNDYAFSLENKLMFAARKESGIDVYQYNTDTYLYTIKKDLRVKNLFYQYGKLIALGEDDNGKYQATFIDSATTGIQDPPGSRDPITLIKNISVSKAGEESLIWDILVPVNTAFAFQFNQIKNIDPRQIDLLGPEGKVNFETTVKDKVLYIYPKILNPLTTYKLTINRNAIFGEASQNLQDPIVRQFITGSDWVNFNKKWHYYNSTSGQFLTGWHEISGSKYYFNKEGERQTGWHSIGGKKYYFNTSGVMQTGWESIGGKKYFFKTSGVMHTGWRMIDGKKYYFNTSGVMQTGWLKISSKKYYFDKKGVMLTGKRSINGKKYYFDQYGFLIK